MAFQLFKQNRQVSYFGKIFIALELHVLFCIENTLCSKLVAEGIVGYCWIENFRYQLDFTVWYTPAYISIYQLRSRKHASILRMFLIEENDYRFSWLNIFIDLRNQLLQLS